MSVTPTKELVEAFEKNRSAMYRAARKVGSTHQEAQDAIGQGFERLVKLQDTILYADEKKLRGLFCATVRRRAIKAFTANNRDAERIKYWLEESGALETGVGSVERAIGVHRALASLDDQERWIAWRYWALDYSLQEIVEDLRAKGVVWSRQYLHKYMRKFLRPKLKRALQKEGF